MIEVKVGNVINIGQLRAVISQIYDDENIEAVYFDGKRHINEGAVKKDGKWEFKLSGACGGYADNNPRLAEFVFILKYYKD